MYIRKYLNHQNWCSTVSNFLQISLIENKEFIKNYSKLYVERLNKIGCKVLKRSNPNYFGNLNISIPRHMQIVIVQNKIQPYLNQTSSNYTKTNSLIINLEPKVSIFLSKIVAEHLTVQSLYLKWLWNKDLTSVLSFWLPTAQFLYLKQKSYISFELILYTVFSLLCS